MRKYERMRKKQLGGCDYSILACVVVGLIIGVIYAVMLSKQYELYYTIWQLMIDPSEVSAYQVFKNSMFTYSVQLGCVMLGACYKWSRYLGYVMGIGVSFSFGFSIGAIILLYGFKGILISVGLLGIPAVIVLGGMICLYSLKEYFKKLDKKQLSVCWGVTGIVCAGVSVFNIYIQPVIGQIIYYIL